MSKKVYDKHEAAAFLDCSLANINYHLYVSKLLPKPTRYYGRLVWTHSQLQTFKGNPARRTGNGSGRQMVTVSHMMQESTSASTGDFYLLRGDALGGVQFRGEPVTQISRPAGGRIYKIHTTANIYQVSGNARLIVKDSE